MKYHGTAAEFERTLTEAGFRGTWENKGADGHHYRDPRGGTIIFWERTGTVVVQGKADQKASLDSRLLRATAGADATRDADAQPASVPRIFVVHGHGVASRDELELALRRLGLEPFILMNSSGAGLTIIEALEGHIGRDFTSSFGIVLLTPDDMGYAAVEGSDRIEPRARQNVILETGMLLASLTRERMAVLVKGHLELPSDLGGMVYLGFNHHVREVLPKLVARLREAGMTVDPSKLSEAMA